MVPNFLVKDFFDPVLPDEAIPVLFFKDSAWVLFYYVTPAVFNKAT
jgi:hypothetical protein